MAAIPQNLLDEIRDLKRRLRAIEGRAHIRPAMNRVLNGETIIGEGGQLLVNSPNGHNILQLGKLYAELDEFGFVLRREDGTIAISVLNGSGTPSEPQVIRIADAQGHLLFAEDVVAGGLARPLLPYPLPVRQDTANWPSTSSSSYVTIAQSFARLQHPRMAVRVGTASAGGATSQVRVIVDGLTLAESAPGMALVDTAEVPGYEFDAEVAVELQARVASGTGTVFAAVESLYGVQS